MRRDRSGQFRRHEREGGVARGRTEFVAVFQLLANNTRIIALPTTLRRECSLSSLSSLDSGPRVFYGQNRLSEYS